jgi:hypothetical protein
MQTLEFSLLVLEHLALYLPVWLVCAVIYRLLFWRTVNSIFDPLYISVIFINSICTANVIFLSILGNIRQYYTLSYLCSEAALLAGILLLSRPQKVLLQPEPRPEFVRRLGVGMIVTIVLVIFANLIVYVERGIPLLMPIRADASGGGTGFGFMTRLSQTAMSLFVLMYYAKMKMTGVRNSLAERSMFFITVLVGLLSGYKAFFIFFFFAYLVFRGYAPRSSFKRDLQIVSIGTVLMICIFGIVQETSDIGLAFAGLMTRLLASGDIYYMVYVDDTLKSLPTQNFFFQLSGQILASLRIIDWSQAPLNYGYVVNEVVNFSDQNLGPTFRYNVLWQLLTGSPELTVLLSFILGLIIGGLNRILNGFKEPGFRFILLALFYYKSFLLLLGPDQAINDIFLTVVILVPILFVIFLPTSCFKRSLKVSTLSLNKSL